MRHTLLLISLLVSMGCNDDYVTPPADTNLLAGRITGILALPSDAGAGDAIFATDCVFCHPTDGSAGAGKALGTWIPDHTPEQALTAILAGTPGGMPSFELTDQEAADLWAYLDTQFP